MSPVGCKYCPCRTFVDASNLKETAKFEGHSGSSFKEIWDFVNQHKGKRAKIHFELKGFTEWGNDEEEVVILDEYGIWWLEDYMGAEEEYRKTNDAYIHNITIYS